MSFPKGNLRLPFLLLPLPSFCHPPKEDLLFALSFRSAAEESAFSQPAIVPFPFSCHLRRARSLASRAEGPLDTSLGRIPRVLKRSVLLKRTGFSRAASHAFAMRLQPAEARLFAMRRLFQQPSEGLSYTAPDERLIAQVPNPY